jgi:phosphopantothenoylcysteine synthetase/decarboxylase
MSIENKIDKYLADCSPLVKNNPLTKKKEELLNKQKANFKPSGLLGSVKEQFEGDLDMENAPDESLFSKMEQLVYSLDPDALTDDQLALRDEILGELENEFVEEGVLGESDDEDKMAKLRAMKKGGKKKESDKDDEKDDDKDDEDEDDKKDDKTGGNGGSMKDKMAKLRAMKK